MSNKQHQTELLTASDEFLVNWLNKRGRTLAELDKGIAQEARRRGISIIDCCGGGRVKFAKVGRHAETS